MPTKYRTLIRNEDICKTGWSKVICLDTEGATNELAIIDGNEKVLFNGLSTDVITSKAGKAKIQKILYDAYFIVGYSLNSDLRNLSDMGFKIADETICLDVYPLTVSRLNRICGDLCKPKPESYTLRNVAETAGVTIPAEGKWHQSQFDALVTLRLFKLFQVGYLYSVGLTTPSIEINYDVRLVDDAETKAEKIAPVKTDTSSDRKTDSCMYEVIQMMDSTWKSTEMKDFGNGFYEALLYKERESNTILVRLSKFEYSGLFTMREINPAYSLASYYFDVILPGRKVKIEKALEEAKKNEAEN